MRRPRVEKRVAVGSSARLVLGVALLVPLGVIVLELTQLVGVGLAAPSTISFASTAPGITNRRPASSNAAPPPTLESPTARSQPTATPVRPLATATAAPDKGAAYVVRAGDELKHIAAAYNVSMARLIATNNIPDPDSLVIGQELHIPSP